MVLKLRTTFFPNFKFRSLQIKFEPGPERPGFKFARLHYTTSLSATYLFYLSDFSFFAHTSAIRTCVVLGTFHVLELSILRRVILAITHSGSIGKMSYDFCLFSPLDRKARKAEN